MKKPTKPTSNPELRGPLDHDVRTQIVEAAEEYFSHYGYEKTTVSDLAKAIGEVICSGRLGKIMKAVGVATSTAPSASERLRRMFRALVEAGSDLFFHERKLHDLAAAAAGAQWPSVRTYEGQVRQLIEQIIAEGRKSGEFERKTPLDETVNAILLVMHPYVNPLLLQHNLDFA